MWPRATNPENWLPQSQFIKVISTVRIRRTGGSEIHERVAQLFVVVHTLCLNYNLLERCISRFIGTRCTMMSRKISVARSFVFPPFCFSVVLFFMVLLYLMLLDDQSFY